MNQLMVDPTDAYNINIRLGLSPLHVCVKRLLKLLWNACWHAGSRPDTRCPLPDAPLPFHSVVLPQLGGQMTTYQRVMKYGTCVRHIWKTSLLTSVAVVGVFVLLWKPFVVLWHVIWIMLMATMMIQEPTANDSSIRMCVCPASHLLHFGFLTDC